MRCNLVGHLLASGDVEAEIAAIRDMCLEGSLTRTLHSRWHAGLGLVLPVLLLVAEGGAGAVAVAPPIIDGRITEGEYASHYQARRIGMEVHWTIEGDSIYFGLQAPATGWLAVGWDPWIYGGRLWERPRLRWLAFTLGAGGFLSLMLVGSTGGHLAGKRSMLDEVLHYLGINTHLLFTLSRSAIFLTLSAVTLLVLTAGIRRAIWSRTFERPLEGGVQAHVVRRVPPPRTP